MFKNFLEISVAMSFVIIFVFIISKRRYASKDIEYTCDDIVTKDLSLEHDFKKSFEKLEI